MIAIARGTLLCVLQVHRRLYLQSSGAIPVFIVVLGIVVLYVNFSAIVISAISYALGIVNYNSMDNRPTGTPMSASVELLISAVVHCLGYSLAGFR